MPVPFLLQWFGLPWHSNVHGFLYEVVSSRFYFTAMMQKPNGICCCHFMSIFLFWGPRMIIFNFFIHCKLVWRLHSRLLWEIDPHSLVPSSCFNFVFNGQQLISLRSLEKPLSVWPQAVAWAILLARKRRIFGGTYWCFRVFADKY